MKNYTLRNSLLSASIAATVLMVGAVPTTAFAQPMNAPVIDKLQADIRERIQQGIRTGQLSSREAEGLLARERGLRAEENRARRDGRLTPAERERLRTALVDLREDVERRIARPDRDDRRADRELTRMFAEVQTLIRVGAERRELARPEVRRFQQSLDGLERRRAVLTDRNGNMRDRDRDQISAQLTDLRRDVRRAIDDRGPGRPFPQRY